MTSLLIQEKLPEGVNLPLGPSTVCTSLKTKGHVGQRFLPHGKVMPETSFGPACLLCSCPYGENSSPQCLLLPYCESCM